MFEALNKPESDVAVAEAAPAPESVETPTEVQAPTPPTSKDLRNQKNRQRQEVNSGLRPVLELVDSGQFSDEELMQYIGPWMEKFAGQPQNLAELLDYFEATKEIISDEFPPEHRVEVACALAELVAEGTLDAETLQALAGKVIYKESGGSFDKVAEYDPEKLGIVVYAELFQDYKGKAQNIVHILKHEIAHGLSRHGEIGRDDQTQVEIYRMIGDANKLKGRETHRSINAIDRYLSAPPEEREKIVHWLAEELRAEKVAAYLESNGDFGSFIEAQLKVMPEENIKQLFSSENEDLCGQWLKENRVIFDQIAAQMKDRTAVRENILASTEEARAELEGYSDDELEDYLSGGGGEPAMEADNSKTTGSPGGQENGWISSLAQLADAFGKEVGTTPVDELVKDKTA